MPKRNCRRLLVPYPIGLRLASSPRSVKSLLVTPENPADLKLLRELLRRFNVQTRELSETESEDLGLSHLMKAAVGSPVVSRSSVLKKLRG